jgi:hypothetical protein
MDAAGIGSSAVARARPSTATVSRSVIPYHDSRPRRARTSRPPPPQSLGTGYPRTRAVARAGCPATLARTPVRRTGRATEYGSCRSQRPARRNRVSRTARIRFGSRPARRGRSLRDFATPAPTAASRPREASGYRLRWVPGRPLVAGRRSSAANAGSPAAARSPAAGRSAPATRPERTRPAPQLHPRRLHDLRHVADAHDLRRSVRFYSIRSVNRLVPCRLQARRLLTLAWPAGAPRGDRAGCGGRRPRFCLRPV